MPAFRLGNFEQWLLYINITYGFLCMKFDDWVQKRMFLFMVLFIVLAIISGRNDLFGLNRTVNWAWDFSNWFFYSNMASWPLFFIGYGIIALLKCRTNRSLSLIHLILVSAILMVYYLPLESMAFIIITLKGLSFFVFALNLIWAIANRKRYRSQV